VDTIKLNYVTLRRNNLKIFGINKSKTLIDFVSTEKDVQKGNTRMPLALSRVYEEDMMSETEVEKAKVEMKMKGMKIDSPTNKDDDDLLANIEHKQNMFRKQSTLHKATAATDGDDSPRQGGRGVSVYCRRPLPDDKEDISQYAFEDFEIVRLIGRGTFGKVYLVKNPKSSKTYAMKSIRKDVVIDHDSLESLQVEKLILLQVRHPFIISMEHVFTKEARIYFIMEFIQGGELFHHLSDQRRFGEDRTRFYSAQIALALGYLHKSKIYYRDLKPENILIGLDGYI